MPRTSRLIAAAAVAVVFTGGAAWAQDGGAKSAGSGPTRVIGETSTVYVPIVPCRVVDTRSSAATGSNAGPFEPNEVRALRVYDGVGYVPQGGKAGTCGISGDSLAVEASITAIKPTADGYARAFPTGASTPNATSLNYSAGVTITNTGAVSVSGEDEQDLTVKNYGGTTDIVIDIQGYYAAVQTN